MITAEMIAAACKALPDGAEYGPGHIVIADGNVRDEDLLFALEQCDIYDRIRAGKEDSIVPSRLDTCKRDGPASQKCVSAVRKFLKLMKRAPLIERVRWTVLHYPKESYEEAFELAKRQARIV
jgi:hypothetical protein